MGIRLRRWGIFAAMAGVVIVIAVSIRVIYALPTELRTYVALSTVAGALVLGGLVTLIFVIPLAGSNPEVKTEFHSARAAYLCVIAGLGLFAAVAIGALIARVALTIRGK